MTNDVDAPSRPGKGGVVPPLEHRWQPGQSGNPAGRTTAGASVREWINAFAAYTHEEMQAVMTDPKATNAKTAAARAWLHATTDRCTKQGVPIAGPDLDRIMGHTELSVAQAERNKRLDDGKPTDNVVTGVVMRVVGPRRDVVEDRG